MSRLPRFLAIFVGEWRGQYRDLTDVHARDALYERRWDPVRSRRARMILVIVGALLIAAVIPVFALSTIAGIGVTVGIVACWFLLRRSLREIGDLPDRVLDERQVALRNRAYRIAWRIFMGVFTTALALTLGLMIGGGAANGLAAPLEFSLPLGVALGLVVALAGVSAILPYAVLAWLEPGEQLGSEPSDLRVLR